MFSPRLSILSAALLLLAVPTASLAQEGLERPKRLGQERLIVPQFKRGDRPVIVPGDDAATKDNLKQIENLVTFYAHGLTEPNDEKNLVKYLEGASGGFTGLRPYLLVRATKPLPVPRSRMRETVGFGGETKYFVVNDNQKQFVKAFGDVMLQKLDNVFKEAAKKNKPVITVNAGKMLVALASTGYEESADYALKVLKDPASTDVLRLYAIKTLGALLAVANPERPDGAKMTVITKEARLHDTVKTLIALIDRKTDEEPPLEKPSDGPTIRANFSKNPAVVAYLRREAVNALAGFPTQVMRDVNSAPIAFPAHALLKVAVADTRLDPVPALNERMDALIGFLHMIPDDDPVNPIDPRYSAWSVVHVGYAMLTKLNRERAAAGELPPTVPWKLTGYRLSSALEAWQAGMKQVNVADAASCVELADTLNRTVAEQLQREGTEARPPKSGMDAWAKKYGPPPGQGKTLFQGAAATALAPGQGR